MRSTVILGLNIELTHFEKLMTRGDIFEIFESTMKV